MEKKVIPEVNSRRQKAEEILKNRQFEREVNAGNHAQFCSTIAEHLEIIHELAVHQTELEMQNEELLAAIDKAATATALYDFSPSAFFTIDSNGIICELNHNGARLLKKEHSELTNRSFLHFLSPDTIHVFKNFLDKSILSDSVQKCEVKLLINENSSLHIHLEGFVSILEHQCLVTAIDITANKKAEEAILLSESRLKRAEIVSKTGNWELHIDSQKIFASDGAIQLYGVNKERLKYSDIKNLVLPDYRPLLDQSLKNLIEFNIPYDVEFKIKRQDTSVVKDIHSIATFDKEKRILFGSIQDITERKLMEDRLQESEQYYRTIVETSPDAIVILDTKGQIQFASLRAYEIFFLPSDTPIGSSIIQWISPEMIELTSSRFNAILTGIIEPVPYEYKIARSNGTTVWAEIHGTKLRKSGGQTKGLFLICRDVTERKRSELELIAAKEKAEESDRLKSAFLANMSHEIRTPLNSIIGFSELMSDPDFDPDREYQFAQIIHASGNNLLSIISDIMDISKIEAGQVEVKRRLFSIHQLLSDLQKEYSFKAFERGIELILDPLNPTEEVFIESDQTKVRQILVNLVGNSIKFTEEGSVKIGLRINASEVQFHVKDTGIGISAEFQSHIFERFRQVESQYTRKYGGTGLGLAISKSLVELLGGTLWLLSEQGKGSTFYFTIPIGHHVDNKKFNSSS